jgi:hypothetical protein
MNNTGEHSPYLSFFLILSFTVVFSCAVVIFQLLGVEISQNHWSASFPSTIYKTFGSKVDEPFRIHAETVVIVCAGGDNLEKSRKWMKLQTQALDAFLPRYTRIVVDDMLTSNATFMSLASVCNETRSICTPSRHLRSQKLPYSYLGSMRAASALNDGLRFFHSHPLRNETKYLLILDLDMLPFRCINMSDIFRYPAPPVFGVRTKIFWPTKYNITYSLWMGLSAWDISRIPNNTFQEIDFLPIHGVGDAGAATIHFLSNHPELKYKFVPGSSPFCHSSFLKEQFRIVWEYEPENRHPGILWDCRIFHSLSGSNWNKLPIEWHMRRLAHIESYLTNLTTNRKQDFACAKSGFLRRQKTCPSCYTHSNIDVSEECIISGENCPPRLSSP